MHKHSLSKFIFFFLVYECLFSCNQGANNQSKTVESARKDTILCLPGSSKVDVAKIEAITGMKGTEKNGEYKITVPQHDLNIVVDGFKIIPPMGRFYAMRR